MSAAAESFVQPEWLWGILGTRPSAGADSIELDGRTWSIVQGIPRAPGADSVAQHQTSGTFGFKWAKRSTFESFAGSFTPRWLGEKYGPFASLAFLDDHGSAPVVLDAGCGAGMSGMAFFRERMAAIRYLGADISDSVDVAAMRAKEFGYEAALLQCDLNELPLLQQSVDVVFSEGVLHHTDNTQKALEQLVQHLKPLGRVMFYVYRVKGPIREFTDDYIRSQLSNLEPDAVWKALEPLTALGVQLGELGIELDIAKPIDLLGIPAGKIDLQRFFYWHVFKAFYRPEMSFDEMQHVNFDWYAPANARRHSPEEVRVWCEKLNLYIEHEHLEEAGITIVARKRG